jgi:hypothetical protein
MKVSFINKCDFYGCFGKCLGCIKPTKSPTNDYNMVRRLVLASFNIRVLSSNEFVDD